MTEVPIEWALNKDILKGLLQHLVNMAACPLNRACNFKTAKCYRFSCSFHEIYVFIVNMYMSQQINLFLYLLFLREHGHGHVITLGQQSSQVKLYYSCGHLISLKNCISPFHTLCVLQYAVLVFKPQTTCVYCGKRHRRHRSKIIGQIQQIQVVHISSSSTPNPKASNTHSTELI